MELRTTATEIFLQTMELLHVEEVMRRRVWLDEQTLRLESLAYALPNYDRLVVISVGKAATPLYAALRRTLEPALGNGQTLYAVVVGSASPDPLDPDVQHFRGGHPLPSSASRDAADAVLTLLSSCDEQSLVVFLISGGASAMLEKPLSSLITDQEAAEFHRALVHSGLAITEMNVLRKHFSAVKGGRLAVAAGRATQCTLLISDVPEDQVHVVGSGPSLPDPSTAKDCREILHSHRDRLRLSAPVLRFFADPDLEETPKPGDPAFLRSQWISLLSSQDLCETAQGLALSLGFHAVIDNRCDEWVCRDAAAYLLQRLAELRRLHPRVCLLTAGEISVPVPAQHGVGGRNQHFALECARLLGESSFRATVLSAGSDGVDGNSRAAGAVADQTTSARAAALGLNVTRELENFNSSAIFEPLGDAIVTGPTGNNVRDLRILLSEEDPSGAETHRPG